MKNLINDIEIGGVRDALNILAKAGNEELFEKAKHQIGDSHPKWPQLKWTDLGGGKFGWRTGTGRGKRASSGQANTGSNAGQAKPAKTVKTDTTEKKLRPVGTGTNGPERRRKEVGNFSAPNGVTLTPDNAGEYENKLNAILDKKGYFAHATKGGSIEIYKKGDRMAMKNLKAAVYSDDYISWGSNEKTLKPTLESVIKSVFTDSGNASQASQTSQAKPAKTATTETKVGDVSKLTARQKSMVDEVMDTGFLMLNNKYNDKSKVELKKTPKGNWRCYYDGKEIGSTISSKIISDATAKKIGWYKDTPQDKTLRQIQQKKKEQKEVTSSRNKIDLKDKKQASKKEDKYEPRTLDEVKYSEIIDHIKEMNGVSTAQAKRFVEGLSTESYLDVIRAILKKEEKLYRSGWRKEK